MTVDCSNWPLINTANRVNRFLVCADRAAKQRAFVASAFELVISKLPENRDCGRGRHIGARCTQKES